MRAALTALALLGILALAAGCGGGDSDSATTATGASAPAVEGGEGGTTTAAEGSGGAKDGGGAGAGSAGQGGGAAPPSGSGLTEKAKPDVKGFKVPPGGDDSIQTFGEEAESSEEDEILAAMASFLRAMANDDYPAICAGLSEANRTQLEQLAKLKKELGSDCPSLLQKLLVGPNSEARKAAAGTVYQVRVEGENAFILFTPLGGTASYFVMKHDPDGWKSTSLGVGTPFNPGAQTGG
jgi:hypothetical protein